MKLIMVFAISSIISAPISCFAGPFQCIEGDCINGFGTYELPLGAKYIGEFKNRKYHGKGTYIFHDGTRNTGTWIDGKQDGKGTVVYPNGKIKYIFCDNGKCE